MRALDRISLLDTIGRELQSRMSFSDIKAFLATFGVDPKKKWSGTNSKWVYTKETLADESDEIVLKIADELGIDHAFSTAATADSKFWLPGHLRVFISHVSKHKVTASHLKSALRRFAISSFVAHEDIEPTKEWLVEIEKALFSMDALVAILTPEFPNSQWTDQEVGIAIGRQVLVVPIRKGHDPYGFIGKYQGLQSHNKTVKQVAADLFDILRSNPRTQERMYGAIVRQLGSVKSTDDANGWLGLLEAADEIPRSPLETLQTATAENSFLLADNDTRERLSALMQRQGLVLPVAAGSIAYNDEVPF